MAPESIDNITQAIQLALGPAFLLTGIAGMLNVMAGRLSRIIDRGRVLMGDPVADDVLAHESLRLELRDLERRRHLTSVAITACTVAALLVCIVIASLFLEVLLHAPLNWFVGGLFTASTFALIVGLAFFLREVHLATSTIRFSNRESGK